MVNIDKSQFDDVLKLRRLLPREEVGERLDIRERYVSYLKPALSNYDILTSDLEIEEMAEELGIGYWKVVECRSVLRQLGLDVEDRRGSGCASEKKGNRGG